MTQEYIGASARRRRAATVAGTTVAALVATALTALPASAELPSSTMSLVAAGDVVTDTSAVLDLTGYPAAWPKIGTAAGTGWTWGTDAIDAGLSADGTAVRISNAVTSGTMNQLITPKLGRSASEAGDYDELDASFTLAPAAGYQDGLLLQVSPDSGTAQRSGGVVTLWHHDGQLQVGAIYTLPGVGAQDANQWFNRTLATVDPTVGHDIGLRHVYVTDGADRLVVSVDGDEVGTVGTFEEYHATSVPPVTTTTNSLAFRAATSVPDADGRGWGQQPAVPAHAGQGFLVSDIEYSLADAPAVETPQDTTITTTSSNLDDWTFGDRTLGRHALLSDGMHVWTDASVTPPGSQHKSAGYYAVDWSLTDVAAAPEPSQDTTVRSGGYEPGLQLSVDLDGDGDFDGYLVGEGYRDYWWLSEASADFLADPLSAGMDKGADAGQTHVRFRGSLAEWAGQFPSAGIDRVGYSFGSGAIGDLTLHSMTYNHTTWDFAVSEPQVCTDTSSGPVVTATNQQGWSFAESRSKGHNEFVDGGLHVWTEDSTSLSKAAGYVALAAPLPLDEVGSPELVLEDVSGVAPSLQLGVDRDGNGTWDGYLVYEPRSYEAGHWWINKTGWGVPAGMGYPSYGTLGEFASHNPDAAVIAVGYSLGSGVQGSAVITSLTVGCSAVAFSAATQPDTYPTTSTELSTNSAPNGWTAGATADSSGSGRWVDGGYTFSAPGDWAETWIEHDYSGDLASLGTVDFEASRVQYVGVHVHTAKGWIVFEKDASYGGKWWSHDDFGVGGQWGLTSFATLGDYITNNPDLLVDKVRVLYTSPTAAKTTLASVTFGGVRHAFDYVAPPAPTYLLVDPATTFAGRSATLDVDVRPTTAAGTVTVTEGDVVLGTAELVAGAVTVTLTDQLATGEHQVTVTYEGDETNASSSQDTTVTVLKNEATVVASWPATLAYGQSRVLPVTVSTDGTEATGTVEVLEGDQVVGSGLLVAGAANVALPANLSIGRHTFTVRYSGDDNTEPAATAAVSVKVTKAPVQMVVEQSAFVHGTPGTLKVTLSATGVTPAGKVVLRGVGESIIRVASIVDGVATFTMPKGWRAGDHRVELIYAGTVHTVSVKKVVSVTVERAPSTTTVTMRTSERPVAVVRVTAAGVVPTGVVKLTVARGTTTVKTVWTTLANGRAVVAIGTLPAGSYTVKASYVGTANVTASSSRRVGFTS